MKMKNLEIFSIAQAYNDAFANFNEYLPVKVSFFMQKNIQTLNKLAQDIDEARMKIVSNYGELSEDGMQYIVPSESIEIANEELTTLLEIEQEVAVHKIKLDAFDGIRFNPEQMQAIMFMIDEE